MLLNPFYEPAVRNEEVDSDEENERIVEEGTGVNSEHLLILKQKVDGISGMF